jgi:hypothetical protein
VSLERDALSLVSTIVELLERKSSGSGLESRDYGHRDPSRWPRGTLYPQKLALTSPTSGDRSVGIVYSLTKEFILVGISVWLTQCVLPILVVTRAVRMRERLTPVLPVSPRRCAVWINYGTQEGTQQVNSDARSLHRITSLCLSTRSVLFASRFRQKFCMLLLLTRLCYVQLWPHSYSVDHLNSAGPTNMQDFPSFCNCKFLVWNVLFWPMSL